MSKLVCDMDDLPGKSTVGIFGAGKCGHYTKRYLEKYRPDIAVSCYIDSYKEGVKDGIPILPCEKAFKSTGIDSIVIASHYWKEILDSLHDKKISTYLLHPLLNLGVFYTEKEYNAIKHSIDEASSIFNDKSRHIYLELIHKRVLRKDVLLRTPFDDQGSLANLHQIFQQYPPGGNAYEDYIDFSRIRTVIEGGVFDGYNTDRFVSLTDNDCRVFAFEPLMDAFKSSPLAGKLLESEKVRIIQKALWSSKSTKHLYKSGPGSCIVEADEASGQTMEVELTSIDAFSSENGLASVDYIKLDIEGAEMDALRGASRTIAEDRPQMAVAIYHTKEDILDIPLHLGRTCDFYRYEIGHYSPGVFETILYALPR